MDRLLNRRGRLASNTAHESESPIYDQLGCVHAIEVVSAGVFLLARSVLRRRVRVVPAEAVPVIDVFAQYD